MSKEAGKFKGEVIDGTPERTDGSLRELLELDFTPLFQEATRRPSIIQAQFYAAFFEGIGYQDMEEMGKAIVRLSRIKWFEPQPELNQIMLETSATNAYRSFVAYEDVEKTSIPELVIVTDIKTALDISEMFNERDTNSYGYEYPYREGLLELVTPAAIKQKEKHSLGDLWEGVSQPQEFVWNFICQRAFEEANKIADQTEIQIEGTVAEAKKEIEDLSSVFTSDLITITNAHLTYIDAGINPNPYEDLIAIYEAGTVPLGGTDGRFYVFIPNLEEVIAINRGTVSLPDPASHNPINAD